MKRIGLFPIICGILLLSIPIFMNAQPYPDYAMGFVTPQAMHSVIRYYSPTQAVVANHNYRLGPPVVNYTTISVVDNSGNINSIDMDAGYQVYDMEIVDDYLIMCGKR